MRRTLLVLDAAIVVLFGMLELTGARADVGFISDGRVTAVGLAYFVAYFAVVLWVPITTLALILDAGCGRLVQTWRASRRP